DAAAPAAAPTDTSVADPSATAPDPSATTTAPVDTSTTDASASTDPSASSGDDAPASGHGAGSNGVQASAGDGSAASSPARPDAPRSHAPVAAARRSLRAPAGLGLAVEPRRLAARPRRAAGGGADGRGARDRRRASADGAGACRREGPR